MDGPTPLGWATPSRPGSGRSTSRGMIARLGSRRRKRARSPSSATRCAPGRIGAGRAPCGAPWSAWRARSPTSVGSSSVRRPDSAAVPMPRSRPSCGSAPTSSRRTGAGPHRPGAHPGRHPTRLSRGPHRVGRSPGPPLPHRAAVSARVLHHLRPLGNYQRVALAEKVFGPARVQAIVTRVARVSTAGAIRTPRRAGLSRGSFCETLLLNRSPRLQDLSPARLDDLRRAAGPEKHSGLHQLQRALAALGIWTPRRPPWSRAPPSRAWRRAGRAGRIAGKPPPRSPPPRGGMSASAS